MPAVEARMPSSNEVILPLLSMVMNDSSPTVAVLMPTPPVETNVPLLVSLMKLPLLTVVMRMQSPAKVQSAPLSIVTELV
jgi:hypothetical protein